MVLRICRPALTALALLMATSAQLNASPASTSGEYAAARRAAHEILAAVRREGVEAVRSRLGSPAERAALPAPSEAAVAAASPLVGTWIIDVPGAPDAPGFSALQTFGADGTFVETSSLLGTVPEGPAHGAWRPVAGGYLLTFQLFTFDAEGAHSGRVRVRAFLRIPGPGRLEADTAVDVLLPDGTVLEEVATGPYSGRRLRIVAP